jgi:predicted outer membrane repeat protein
LQKQKLGAISGQIALTTMAGLSGPSETENQPVVERKTIMTLFSWLRSRTMTRPPRGGAHRPAAPRFCPRLEALEDRWMPSTYTVTSVRDGEIPGTLRYGIDFYANQGFVDTIVFDPRLNGQTIQLYGGELLIQSPNISRLTIQGPGAGLLAVSGVGSCRVFKVEPSAGVGAHVTLSGLMIEDGLSVGGTSGNPQDYPGAGGGIFNTATLTVSGCSITNNTATNSNQDRFGGGIFNQGILTVTGSTLSGNHSNFGGGIDNEGTLTVSGCTLSSNSASAGGGIVNSDTATITNCTFSNNSASGGGGGIVGHGTVTLTNCTFSNNSAHVVGGALDLSSVSATLTNCTISLNSANTGGGIWVNPANGGSILNLTNTIVAGNTASTSTDIAGAVATADHNLVGDATGSSGIVNGVNGNIVGGNGNPVINPDLGPLQNNGGPTQTMALLAGSPAIGHGNNAKAPATDQRGFTRLDEPKEITDIGAFEL